MRERDLPFLCIDIISTTDKQAAHANGVVVQIVIILTVGILGWSKNHIRIKVEIASPAPLIIDVIMCNISSLTELMRIFM